MESSDAFDPFEAADPELGAGYFVIVRPGTAERRTRRLVTRASRRLVFEGAAFSWPLRDQSSTEERRDRLPAPLCNERPPGDCSSRRNRRCSQGAPRWGILRGDVDYFDLRLKRADSVEEHIQLSLLFKDFFAGELSILCTLPEFWRKITILYRGGDDFAVLGTWDALLALARELQRLFEKFVAGNLQSFAGLESKSISMALAIGRSASTSAISVFEEAGSQLGAAKATEIGTFHLFGRTLEWKRLADAEELKNGLSAVKKTSIIRPSIFTISRPCTAKPIPRRRRAVPKRSA